MYKNAGRFGQRSTRSNYGLEQRLDSGSRKSEKRRLKNKRGLFVLHDGKIKPVRGSFLKIIGPLIFHLSSQGKNHQSIAAELNRRHIKTSRGRTWTAKNLKAIINELRKQGIWGASVRRR